IPGPAEPVPGQGHPGRLLTECRGQGPLRSAARAWVYRRNLGSSASRRPSDMKLTEIANRKITSPGKNSCHHGKLHGMFRAMSMKQVLICEGRIWMASAETEPHSGNAGDGKMWNPRKTRAPRRSGIEPTSRDIWTNIG